MYLTHTGKVQPYGADIIQRGLPNKITNNFMAAPITKTTPKWLNKSLKDVENKHYRRSINYYRRLYQAYPPWANPKKIAKIYAEARRRRKRGEDVQVDHIVPIVHPTVSGLHCEANLQIISAKENGKKKNYYWPDMWLEQTELNIPLEPQQLNLPIWE